MRWHFPSFPLRSVRKTAPYEAVCGVAEQSDPDKRRLSSYAACLLRYSAQVASVAWLQSFEHRWDCVMSAQPCRTHEGFTVIVKALIELRDFIICPVENVLERFLIDLDYRCHFCGLVKQIISQIFFLSIFSRIFWIDLHCYRTEPFPCLMLF